MGEAIKTRRDGKMYEFFVLNDSYPQDVSFLENANGSATFEVKIALDGKPAEYTYQWYVDNSAVSGATSTTYTMTGLTSARTSTVYCKVTNKAGGIDSRVATLNVISAKPALASSTTASTSIISDGNYNYRIKILSSGNINFSSLGCFEKGIDVFVVGGGGGGASNSARAYGGGGGGGYTKTTKAVSVSANKNYTVTVGAGGSPGAAPGASESIGGTGGTTSAFGVSITGGKGGRDWNTSGGYGGSGGGSAWGPGGSDGADGWTRTNQGGSGTVGGNQGGGLGQHTTTREFGESGAQLYSGGGGGFSSADDYYNGRSYAGGDGGGGASALNGGYSGTTNSGGGGGARGGGGGSGIIVIRNKR